MDISEFINQILLPFGGASAVLIALAAFLGHISTKRIVNGDLANHRRDLESLKSEHSLKLEGLRQEYTQKIESQKIENSRRLSGHPP